MKKYLIFPALLALCFGAFALPGMLRQEPVKIPDVKTNDRPYLDLTASLQKTTTKLSTKLDPSKVPARAPQARTPQAVTRTGDYSYISSIQELMQFTEFYGLDGDFYMSQNDWSYSGHPITYYTDTVGNYYLNLLGENPHYLSTNANSASNDSTSVGGGSTVYDLTPAKFDFSQYPTEESIEFWNTCQQVNHAVAGSSTEAQGVITLAQEAGMDEGYAYFYFNQPTNPVDYTRFVQIDSIVNVLQFGDAGMNAGFGGCYFVPSPEQIQGLMRTSIVFRLVPGENASNTSASLNIGVRDINAAGPDLQSISYADLTANTEAGLWYKAVIEYSPTYALRINFGQLIWGDNIQIAQIKFEGIQSSEEEYEPVSEIYSGALNDLMVVNDYSDNTEEPELKKLPPLLPMVAIKDGRAVISTSQPLYNDGNEIWYLFSVDQNGEFVGLYEDIELWNYDGTIHFMYNNEEVSMLIAYGWDSDWNFIEDKYDFIENAVICKPNTTISWTDEDDNAYEERIYSFQQDDKFTISRLPIDYQTYAIDFDYINDMVISMGGAPVYPSIVIDENNETGDFLLYGFDGEYLTELIGYCANDGYDIEFGEQWLLFTENGYTFGFQNPLHISLDYQLGAKPEYPSLKDDAPYLVGYFCDWSFYPENELTQIAENIYEIQGVYLPAYDEFKIASPEWSNINLGSYENPLKLNTMYTLSENGGNMYLETDLVNATITLDLSTNQCFIRSENAPADDNEVVDMVVDWTSTPWNSYVMGYIPDRNTEEGLIFEWPNFSYVMVDDDYAQDYETVNINGQDHYIVPTEDGGPREDWGIQAHILPQNVDTKIGTSYSITIVGKSNKAGATIGMPMAWGWDAGKNVSGMITFDGTGNWEEHTFTYDEVGGTSCWIIGQMYSHDNDARICIKSVKITHKESAPTQETGWINCLVNGDAEGEYGDVPCAYSKEYQGIQDGMEIAQPQPAEIIDMDGNKVFVVRAKEVDPYEYPESFIYEDGSVNGSTTWQNEFWILSPNTWNTNDVIRISFRYKADKPATANTQAHREPANYLHWAILGDISFTTEWQEFSKEITVNSSQDGMRSIAFNFSDYTMDNNYYFDDLKWESLTLDEGWFVCGDFNDWNYGQAIQMSWNEDDYEYQVIVGSQEKPASQICISSKRGDDAAFKSNSIKTYSELMEDEYVDYGLGYQKINLPYEGIWKIHLDDEYQQICVSAVGQTPSLKDGVPYLVGYFCDWSFYPENEMTLIADNIYEIQGINLPAYSEFKIASPNWWDIDLGTYENPLVTGQLYTLTERASNMYLESELVNARMIVNLSNNQFLIINDNEPLTDIRIDSRVDLPTSAQYAAILGGANVTVGYNYNNWDRIGQVEIFNAGEPLNLGSLNIEGRINNRQEGLWGETRLPSIITNEGCNISAEAANITLRLRRCNKWDTYWHFLSLPYDVRYDDIVPAENCIFVARTYNCEARALADFENTWQNVGKGDVIPAHTGFIVSVFSSDDDFPAITFPCAANNKLFNSATVAYELNQIPAEMPNNRSWNFIGNPYPAYFDVKEMSDGSGETFATPFTIWRGYAYESYCALDDDLLLMPFEGILLQSPEDNNLLTFSPEGRYHWDDAYNWNSPGIYAPERLNEMSQREVFNFIASCGDELSNRARIVINEDAKMDFEVGRDATKFFETTNNCPLIYVNGDVNYSICERPLAEGMATLGFSAAVDGSYKLSLSGKHAQGWQVILQDRLTGAQVDLMENDYEFEAKAGQDDSRFTVAFNAPEFSGIDSIVNTADAQAIVTVTNISGVTVYQGAKGQMPKLSAGVYLFTIDGVTSKVSINQ